MVRPAVESHSSDQCIKARATAKAASNDSQVLLVQLRSAAQAVAPGTTYTATDLIAGHFPGSSAPPASTLRQQVTGAVQREMSTIVSSPQCFGSGELAMARQALGASGSG